MKLLITMNFKPSSVHQLISSIHGCMSGNSLFWIVILAYKPYVWKNQSFTHKIPLYQSMSCAVKKNALPVLKTGDVCMNSISQLLHLIW